MSAPLFLRPEAKAELRAGFTWYEGKRVGLGFEYLRTVRVAFAAIERAPELFPFALDDIRKSPLRRFPYAIYYLLEAERIAVLAVFHGRRDPRQWRRRG